MYGIIYIATNKINQKIYIGQTVQTLKKRIKGHKHESIKPKSYIQNAIKKHGFENFTWKILDDSAQSKEELNELEALYIEMFGSSFPNIGYNLNDGGGSFGSPNEATRLKISKAHKGRKYGEDFSKKMSLIMKGRIFSDEHRRKMSENNKGRIPWNKGKSSSEETKKKISEAGKGRIVSKETKRKMSKIGKNRIYSEKRKKQISELGKNKAKSVICLETLEVFDSSSDASNKYGYPSHDYAARCCRGERKSARKLHWRWYEDYILERLF